MNRMNTITDILLCKYLADPATPLTLNSVLGTFFFLWELLVYWLLEKLNISEFV